MFAKAIVLLAVVCAVSEARFLEKGARYQTQMEQVEHLPTKSLSQESFIPAQTHYESKGRVETLQQENFVQAAPLQSVRYESVKGYQAPVQSQIRYESAKGYQAPQLTQFEAPSKTVSYQAPTKTYEAPTKTFQAPAQVYEAPTKTFQAPAQVYEAPTKTFQAPAQVYEAPTKTFQAPAQVYEAPTKSFQAPVQATYQAPVKSMSFQAPIVELQAPILSLPQLARTFRLESFPTKSYSMPIQRVVSYQAPVKEVQSYAQAPLVQQAPVLSQQQQWSTKN